MKILDCAIIGGGPAGLTAGLYASRGGLENVVLFDKGMPGGQIVSSSEIENYPGVKNEVTGIDLMEPWLSQAQKFGLEFEMTGIKNIDKQWDLFIINKEDGTQVFAKTVIICTGASPKRAGIKGEMEFFGRGVSTCATCDGFFHRNKEVVVIGGGDAALEESLYLAKMCSKVYLIHRGSSFKAAPNTVERINNTNNIEVMYETKILEIKGDEFGVTSVDLGSQVLNISGVFVFVGHNINNQVLIKENGKFICNVTANKEICVDLKMKTSLPGLFAAGDIREYASRQVVCAAGDGATAALSAIEYVNSQRD